MVWMKSNIPWAVQRRPRTDSYTRIIVVNRFTRMPISLILWSNSSLKTQSKGIWKSMKISREGDVDYGVFIWFFVRWNEKLVVWNYYFVYFSRFYSPLVSTSYPRIQFVQIISFFWVNCRLFYHLTSEECQNNQYVVQKIT